MKNKILIVDDDKDLCRLIKKFLESENFIINICNCGGAGLTEAVTGNYQLVILDVMLPEKNGFEVLLELRKKSNVPVLMLTAKEGDADKISGLRMGADDYLTKPFNMEELIARVQSHIRRFTVLSGENRAEQSIIYQNLLIDPSLHAVTKNGNIIELTAKEFDLLYFLACNKRKVFTKQQIYLAVWEDAYAYDDNNIMVHIRRLRKKIEDNPDEPTFIQTVWGVGYKFGGKND